MQNSEWEVDRIADFGVAAICIKSDLKFAFLVVNKSLSVIAGGNHVDSN